MRAMHVRVVWAPSYQILMPTRPVIARPTCLPLVQVFNLTYAFISHVRICGTTDLWLIKMYALFSLHHSPASLILLPNIRFVTHISLVSIWFPSIINCTHLLLLNEWRPPVSALSAYFTIGSFLHDRPLIWTQLLIKPSIPAAIYLLSCGYLRLPLMCIPELWRRFRLVNNVFAFRNVTLSRDWKWLRGVMIVTYLDYNDGSNADTRCNRHS